MNKARLLIADDHRVLGESLRDLLAPEFEVVALVADGQELVETAKKYQPDVIVAEVTMSSLGGIEAAMQLRNAGVKAKVVFLTMHRDVAYARRAMEAGAAGYVLKHSPPSELVTAVREALQGGTYITPMIAEELLHWYRERDLGPRGSVRRLTTRQLEVLQLVAEGNSAKHVAAVLNISIRTAEAHKARILGALGLQTTAELVHYAIRNGITSL
jgi:DNA-binding NarL/FixJ family response regulator